MNLSNLSFLKFFSSIMMMFLLMFLSESISASYSLVRNFSPNEYKGGTQNWDAAKDELDRMYFANLSGLLTYDSRNWSIIPNRNYTCLRSLLYEKRTRRIYAGGTAEFGYYYPDSLTGKISYISLIPTLSRPTDNIREVWNIMESNGKVWFQSDYNIFCYDGKHTSVIDVIDKIQTSALINDRFYFFTPRLGACCVLNNKVVKLSGCDSLKDKRVCAILSFKDGQILFVTAFSGLYVYRYGRAEVLNSDLNDFLKANQAFCATTNGSHIIFGTVNCGAVIKSLQDGSKRYVNVNTGSRNNTVLNAYFDETGDVWLMMDNGLTYVTYNSPISNLFGSTNIYGAGYTSLLLNNTLYLGTNQAMYSTPYPIPAEPKPRELEPLLKGQVWSIDTIGGDLLVSSDAGLFQKLPSGFAKIEGVPGSWSVCRLRRHPNKAVVSTYDNLYLIERSSDGRCRMVSRIEGFSDMAGKCYEDNSGYLWSSHWLKGVYRLRLSADLRRVEEVKLFNHTNGLLAESNVALQVIDDRILASTEGGFFSYDNASGNLVTNEEADKIFNKKHLRVFKSPNREYWGISRKHAVVAFPRSSGEFDVDTISFLPLSEKIIPGFEHLNFTKLGKVIASNQDGFYEIDPLKKGDKASYDTIFVSKVYANHDSLVYSAALNYKDFELPYSLNSLRFEFVSPEYRAENAVQYSYYLENYDSEWSSYSTSTVKEYTNLYEGTYRLHIRSVNTYNGAKSQSYLTFTILPPWYRNNIAKGVYFIIFILIVFFAIRLLRNYSKRAALQVLNRKEAELAEIRRKTEEEALRKDYEIAHLKSEQLEHNFRHKSEELSNITMNVIRKNEILLDISSHLKKIAESISDIVPEDVMKRFGKLQRLIHENISHDDDWHNFTKNFDIVYENFLKRLKELHPDLNPSELRLCAYLKMDLSSKEIAPLLNISFRSVEMARYRLRKKMGLSRDMSLVEYLQHL